MAAALSLGVVSSLGLAAPAFAKEKAASGAARVHPGFLAVASPLQTAVTKAKDNPASVPDLVKQVDPLIAAAKSPDDKFGAAVWSWPSVWPPRTPPCSARASCSSWTAARPRLTWSAS
jgi:hypothetical protein